MKTSFLIFPGVLGVTVAMVIVRLSAAEPTASLPLVLVYSNGAVVCPSGVFLGGHAGPGASLRMDFGLPPIAPVRRFMLEGLPILQTEWEYQGVRYTQRVIITRWGEGPLDGRSEDAVLLVQIAGESLAQEYTNATASLAFQTANESWSLELRGGWIYCPGRGQTNPVAFLDIPSVGIVRTNGTRLEFQGNMPPANTGAMTLIIPREPIRGAPLTERLVDMDFNEALQRVRDFWRRPEARKLVPPLAWGEEAVGAAMRGHSSP